MDYITSNNFGGLASLNDYPYDYPFGLENSFGIDDLETCDLTGKSAIVSVSNPKIVVAYDDSSSRDERALKLKSAVARQPIVIAMSAMCNTMSNYQSGILSDDGDCACSDPNCLDHAVLLVGYDDTNSLPYWVIKNSWGPSYGEEGFFRVSQYGGGDYGLFGILGEGILPLNAYNKTAQEPDAKPKQRVFGSWWHITIIAFVCFFLLFCATSCFYRMMKGKSAY